MSWSARIARTFLLTALATVACDSGPEGPGSFTASLGVTGPPAGAVLIDISGEGLLEFGGTGDTQVFHSVMDPLTGSHRLIAVSASGTIGFRVEVARVENGSPVATVVDAAGTDDQPRGPAGIEVRFSN